MEDRDRISDNEIAREDELLVTQGETDEVESEDYVNRRRGRRITFTYPKPAKPEEPEPPEPEPSPEPKPEDDDDDSENTPEARVGAMEKAIRGFRIVSAGDGLLRGGFGKIPDGITNLMQQMQNIENAMNQFNLTGDNLNVSGSFDKGYAVTRENPCQEQQANQGPM